MKIIVKPGEAILQILNNMKMEKSCTRWLHYCVEAPVSEGYLLFNLLTREMVLLTDAEWQNRFENEYLKSHWFLVPESCKDKEYADLVRWVFLSRQKPWKSISSYTIFPTTDCNARCFYCFERGRSRMSMSEETAYKVAAYIADHCNGENVKLKWFGGEPLLKKQCIDIICRELKQKEILFSSLAVSNGYLFDAETVRNAVDNWNLERVQVTLDGTEKVYNRVKAYIYKQNNPYLTVMENIDYLLDAGVFVSIRLNMGMHNEEDLLQLVETLGNRFVKKKRLSIYVNHLFDANKPMADIHDPEEWELRDAAMRRLQKKIIEYGLEQKSGIRKTTKINYCIADSGTAITILPGGEIGLCDLISEEEFIGHIDRESFDQAVIERWKERVTERPECAECFYYPDCLQLKKCTTGSVCFEHLRRERRRQVERQMLNEYNMWKNRETAEQAEEDATC